MFGIGNKLRSLREDRKGNIGILFALMAVPIFAVTGVGVDYSRAYSARVKMQHATDAAALSGALSVNLPQSARVAKAETSFNANGGNLSSGIQVTTDVQFASGMICIEAAANVATTFIRIVNVNSVAVSAKSCASTEGKKLEIAVMLDTTGSMGYPHGGASNPACPAVSKLDALKCAMQILVDTVMPAGANTTKMALVPFAYNVKVPNDNPYSTYTGRTDWPNSRCALERKVGPRPNEAPPVLGTNQFWIKTSNNSSHCYYLHPIVPLTANRAVLDPLFELSDTSLKAYGATAGHIGTQWAWHTISPQWAGRWPSQSTPAAYTDDGTLKVVVLMTDGANTWMHKKQNGYSGGCNGSSSCVVSDNEMKAYCDAMKVPQNSAGGESIMIFAVGFGLPAAGTTAGDNARAVLQHCASIDPLDPARLHYYYPVTQEDIEAVFSVIGQAVSVAVNKPRLVN